MSPFYGLIISRLDKHLFILLLAALVFFILKLFSDFIFIKYLIYLFSNYIYDIKFEEDTTTLFSILFMVFNYLPTLLIYIAFGYFIHSKIPKDRTKEMIVIAASITFFFMFLVYTEHYVYIENTLLEIISAVYYLVPLVGLFVGFNFRKKLR